MLVSGRRQRSVCWLRHPKRRKERHRAGLYRIGCLRGVIFLSCRTQCGIPMIQPSHIPKHGFRPPPEATSPIFALRRALVRALVGTLITRVCVVSQSWLPKSAILNAMQLTRMSHYAFHCSTRIPWFCAMMHSLFG